MQLEHDEHALQELSGIDILLIADGQLRETPSAFG
jgi:hypothetical protein